VDEENIFIQKATVFNVIVEMFYLQVFGNFYHFIMSDTRGTVKIK